MITIDKKLEKEFFDTLDEKLDRAEIAFKAYEKGREDMLSVIKDIKEDIKNYDGFILCANGQRGIHINKVFEIIDEHIMRNEHESNNAK